MGFAIAMKHESRNSLILVFESWHWDKFSSTMFHNISFSNEIIIIFILLHHPLLSISCHLFRVDSAKKAINSVIRVNRIIQSSCYWNINHIYIYYIILPTRRWVYQDVNYILRSWSYEDYLALWKKGYANRYSWVLVRLQRGRGGGYRHP